MTKLNQDVFVAWTRSMAVTLCNLLDLDQTYETMFPTATFCEECQEIVLGAEFATKAVTRFQLQLEIFRETVRKSFNSKIWRHPPASQGRTTKIRRNWYRTPSEINSAYHQDNSYESQRREYSWRRGGITGDFELSLRRLFRRGYCVFFNTCWRDRLGAGSWTGATSCKNLKAWKRKSQAVRQTTS